MEMFKIVFFDERNQVSSSAHFYITRNERTVSTVLLEPVGHSGAVTILRLPTHHRTLLLLFIVLQRCSIEYIGNIENVDGVPVKLC